MKEWIEMFNPPVILGICCSYIGLLFVIALWVERKAASGKNIGNNPVIYTLSLTVFLTTWTYYGSVGKAASRGMLFLAFYLGPTLAMILWWSILRRMVRVKNAYRITSIADFISLRYNKSMSIAALVTMIAVIGLVPYIALQLKAIISASRILTSPPNFEWIPWGGADMGIIFAGLFILFTIILGVRRLVPTERHQGMVVAVAAEGLVKLVGLLAVGLFVTFSLYGGFGNLFQRFLDSPLSKSITEGQTKPSFYITWTSYLLLSMSAFMFVPRQFHMAVVENFHEKHIRTAIWLYPLYTLLITIFFLPIAMGGLLAGNSVETADTFVLLLPLSSGQYWLSLLVFLGGFSAATGMIMICSMTISTMVTNHLLLPAIELTNSLGFLKQYLLQCRWMMVVILILASYWFERYVGIYFTLVDIGVIAHAAVLQFAPAILGGLFWKKGNGIGALLGMGVGSLLWFYTLIVPAFIRGGLISSSLLENGPWGISALRPEHLFGVTGLDPTSHAVLWTMLFNVGLYVLGSLYVEQGQEEQSIAEEFVNILAVGTAPLHQASNVTIDRAVKQEKINALFCQYFSADKAVEATNQCFSALNLLDKSEISIVELAELYSEVEKRLASSIGAATAHQVTHKSAIITGAEENALKQVYSEIVASLKVPPSDLLEKIDYYREKERLLTLQATELEEKIRERDKEILERKKAEEALRDSEQQLADIINFLPDPTFAIDLEGKVIIWNRAAEEFTGTKAEDMLGKGDYEYSIPFYGMRRLILIDLLTSKTEGVDKLYSGLKRKHGVITGEAFSRSAKHGEAYLIGTAALLYDSESQVIGAIESIRDITERKSAEDSLRRRANEFAALYEIAREVAAQLDLSTLLETITQRAIILLNASDAVVYLYDSTHDELELFAASTYAHPQGTRFRVNAGMSGQVVRTRQPLIVDDYRTWKHRRPELANLNLRAVAQVPLIFNDEIIGVLGIGETGTERKFTPTDIRLLELLASEAAIAIQNARLRKELETYSKELELRVIQRTEELNVALHRAQEADRVKSAFLATMSHELRTPLNSIIGFTGVLLQGLAGALSPEQSKQLSIVRDSAHHLLALINDVLDISKIEAGQLQMTHVRFDMRVVIENVLRTVTPQAQKKGLTLTAAIASNVGVVVNDQRRVEQILLNLLSNAIKFSERGEIQLHCHVRDKWLETSVHDTGIGIRSEDLDNLFKPFRQLETGLDRRHEGTGLGLAICKNLVTLMGGQIRAESTWGVGSTFSFTLPLTQEGNMHG